VSLLYGIAGRLRSELAMDRCQDAAGRPVYLVDVPQRVGQHPVAPVAELIPRLWKKRFAASRMSNHNLLRALVTILVGLSLPCSRAFALPVQTDMRATGWPGKVLS
jgi:hypothetical protein